ncbi:MAG: hypothetical protein IIA45_12280 [Bacteroidetes bacterium]|nr:hypothetical protein [Bacteroidota bacterium]
MNDQEKQEKLSGYKERFIRWQQLTIQHLSYTNNLLLTLNLAFLGFLITQTGFELSSNPFLITVQIVSITSLGTSFFVGILTVLNRLHDFRSTTRVANNKRLRFEHKNELKKDLDISKIESEISKHSEIANKRGKKTWIYLQWQIWTFTLGVSVGIIFLLVNQNTSG